MIIGGTVTKAFASHEPRMPYISLHVTSFAINFSCWSVIITTLKLVRLWCSHLILASQYIGYDKAAAAAKKAHKEGTTLTVRRGGGWNVVS